MAVDLLDLRNLSNAELMDGIRSDATLDYQNRIPAATQAGVKAVVDTLTNYRPAWNEFLNAFVNRIGTIYARTSSWSNPLAVFKKGLMGYGDTVEEYMADILTAHTYDPDRDYGEQVLFGQERPDVEVNYHKINRQNFYKFTINDKMLKRAFLNEGGLSQLIGQLMEAPLKSDQWDEFLLMANLFAQNEAQGGFFKVHVPDFAGDTGQDEAREALKTIKALSYRLPFLSREYNAAHMPVSAQPSDLMLVGTPEFLAAVDVDGLAPIFHMDKAAIISERTVPLPGEYLGIDNAQGVLTTKEFFMVFDTLLENRSMENPAGLYNNYFLHHHQIISLSRFVPAILLTAESGTVTLNERFTVSSVSAPTLRDQEGAPATTVERGRIYDVDTTVTTDPVGKRVGVAYSITGNASTHTYITREGVLYVARNETASQITITAHTAAIDPANPRTDSKSASANFTVSGTVADDWPQGGKLAKITIAGVDVVNVKPETLSYTLTLPAGTKVTKGNVKVVTTGSPNTDVVVAVDTGRPGYDVTIAVDAGAGEPVSYTVAVTVPAA